MKSAKDEIVIELQNVKKCFGLGDAKNYAINGINLTINKGEFIAIMGPSGCGKTTLLNILGLLDTSIEGDYLLNGVSVDSLSRRKQAKIRSHNIGFVFQNFNLIPRLTVIDNVALPLVYKGVSKLARIKKASKILHDFHLGEREFYMPYQLSGGQTQRVAIARALVNEPSIILADEPTGNLDSHSSHIIMEELSRLHKQGNTIVMVTHNPNLTSYASRVITMLDGTIDTDTFHIPTNNSNGTNNTNNQPNSSSYLRDSNVSNTPSNTAESNNTDIKEVDTPFSTLPDAINTSVSKTKRPFYKRFTRKNKPKNKTKIKSKKFAKTKKSVKNEDKS